VQIDRGSFALLRMTEVHDAGSVVHDAKLDAGGMLG
jgi:hypothetical protein